MIPRLDVAVDRRRRARPGVASVDSERLRSLLVGNLRLQS
jgi:hypothetical protein